MKKHILLLATILCAHQFFGQAPEVPGNVYDMPHEDVDFYELYNNFNQTLQENPDAFTDSELKKWARFNYFWFNRLQTEDPESTGKMLSYTNQIFEYLTSYVCEESTEESFWEFVGPSSTSGDNMGRVDGLYVKPENPLDILVGTVSSGIWRSINGGENWT